MKKTKRMVEIEQTDLDIKRVTDFVLDECYTADEITRTKVMLLETLYKLKRLKYNTNSIIRLVWAKTIKNKLIKIIVNNDLFDEYFTWYQGRIGG